MYPRNKRIERQGAFTEPSSNKYPQVRGGVCEYCGVLDPNVPSKQQYKLCPHYRGMDLECSYCPDHVNQDDVITQSRLIVVDDPYQPQSLIVCCDRFDCESKHQKRFRVNA